MTSWYFKDEGNWAMYNFLRVQRSKRVETQGWYSEKKAKGLFQAVKKLNKVFQSVKRLLTKIVSSFVFFPTWSNTWGGRSQPGGGERTESMKTITIPSNIFFFAKVWKYEDHYSTIKYFLQKYESMKKIAIALNIFFFKSM